MNWVLPPPPPTALEAPTLACHGRREFPQAGLGCAIPTKPCPKIPRDQLDCGTSGGGRSAVAGLLQADRSPWMDKVAEILRGTRLRGSIRLGELQFVRHFHELVQNPI